MIVTTLLFVVGLALLVMGAELLVRGASKLALALGISPLVIGLTIVAYGTSAPEMAVSIGAGLTGQPSIALGNAVGSNIFNVLFILGLSALIAPLVVNQQLVRVDVPIMIGVSILLWILLLDNHLGKLDGIILVAGSILYSALAVILGRRESQEIETEYAKAVGEPPKKTVSTILLQLVLMAVGLGLLVLGSRWLVNGAVDFAKWLGVSDLVIGLTIIAAGTSLPEVATSVMATIRGQRDIAVGNVVGSNIFNILAILGVASLVTPGGLTAQPALLAFDVPVMTAVALACLPILFTGHLIERWEGGIFFGYYIAYTTYLVLRSMEHAALSTFNYVMVAFILPLTVITILVAVVRTMYGKPELNVAGQDKL